MSLAVRRWISHRRIDLASVGDIPRQTLEGKSGRDCAAQYCCMTTKGSKSGAVQWNRNTPLRSEHGKIVFVPDHGAPNRRACG